MRPLLLISLAAFAARAASVPVCLSAQTRIDNFAVSRAQLIVEKVFADAGVRIEWPNWKQCRNPPAPTIYLILDARVPSDFRRDALGYANPYDSRKQVHIFYDRIRTAHMQDFANVLGHVMAHEIAHVVQGVVRHSDRGLLKATWTLREFNEMHYAPLPFGTEDVQLLQLGLKYLAGNVAAR